MTNDDAAERLHCEMEYEPCLCGCGACLCDGCIGEIGRFGMVALMHERDADRDDARRLRNQLSGSRAFLKTYMAHHHVSEDSPLRQLMVLLDGTSYREGE